MLETLIGMSITGAIISLVVIVARIFMKRLPAKYSYFMWIFVALSLIIPISLETDMSILNTVSKPEIRIDENSVTIYSENIITNEMSPVVIVSKPEYKDSQTEVRRKEIDIEKIIVSVWLTGFVVVIGVNTFQYISIKKKLKTATCEKENIFISEKIKSPFVMGILKPSIYLPKDIEKEGKDYIIAHEKMHIKRLDNIIKPIAFLIVSMHWFNPFIWLSFHLFENDMERSCDEATIYSFNEDVRKEYAETLLKISLKQNGLFVPLSFGEKSVKSRIKNVLYKKKKSAFLSVVAIGIVAFLSGCIASTPKEAESIGIIGGSDGPTAVIVGTPEKEKTETEERKFLSENDICIEYIKDYYNNVFSGEKDLDMFSEYMSDKDVIDAAYTALIYDMNVYSPEKFAKPVVSVVTPSIKKVWENNVCYIKLNYTVDYNNSGFGTLAYFEVEKTADNYKIKRAILSSPADMACGFDGKDIDSAELPFQRAKAYPDIVKESLLKTSFYENSSEYITLYVEENQCNQYDKNGKLIAEYFYDKDGSIAGFTKHIYYDNGNLFEKKEYGGNENLLYRDYFYDERGFMINYYGYDYDEFGRKIKSTYYDSNSLEAWHNVYEYDENGNVIKDSCYLRGETEVSEYKIMEYDEKGNQIKCSAYKDDGTLLHYRIMEYDDYGNLIKFKDYTEE